MSLKQRIAGGLAENEAIGEYHKILNDHPVISASSDHCAIRGYTYQERAPGGYSDWTDYVVRKCNGSTAGIQDPHGHHIVMKGDRFPENAQARQILCKYGINPYTDCANLVVSRNWCHSTRYARKVLMALRQADHPGASIDDIKQVLRDLAVWHRDCSDPNEGDVDAVTDQP